MNEYRQTNSLLKPSPLSGPYPPPHEPNAARRAWIWLLLAVSVGLGALRLIGVTHIAFQAAAHLWVGGLIGARIAGGPKLLTWHAVLLSVLELAAFLYTRFAQ